MPNVVNNYLNENNASGKLCIYIMKIAIKIIQFEESVPDPEQTFCPVVLL